MPPERVPWSELGPEFITSWGWPGGKWEPEHLAILGPTGSGKSFFMTHIIDQRARRSGANAVIIATKPADSTMTRLTRSGEWKMRRTWPPSYGEERVIFWPKATGLAEGVQQQRKAIYEVLAETWKPDANTIVAFDEIAYVEQDLRLQPFITKYWREARSLGITIVATTQRPRYVSRYMHSEPTWSVAFLPSDEDEAKRVAEIIGGRRKYTEVLMSLEPREFLIIHRRKRLAYISRIA
ncbi:ATP-binding protein [Streptomyces sp. A1-5]|uniref:ATP-binding protein n=1 Tax=Streptomyces sp. A1-5 TaxID=2738410 RepID=UPI0022854208|nr:ATP-binding protein [Streptomyces sp. A1-5]